MKKTKKLTLSAMVVALGILFMSVGAFVPAVDLSCSVLASMLVAFVYFELGSPYTFMVWLATSLLSFIFFTGSIMWLSYLLAYGCYPFLKGYIEKLPRLFWVPLKLVFANATIAIMFFFSEALGVGPLFDDVSGIPIAPALVIAAMWIFLVVAFFIYDRVLVVLSAFYEFKIRPKIQNLLK